MSVINKKSLRQSLLGSQSNYVNKNVVLVKPLSFIYIAYVLLLSNRQKLFKVYLHSVHRLIYLKLYFELSLSCTTN